MDCSKKDLAHAAKIATDQVGRVIMGSEAKQRLFHFVVRTHPETGGHDPTVHQIVEREFEQNRTNVRQAIIAFRDGVAPSREAEALAALQEFEKDAIALIDAGDFERLGRRLTAFSYVRNRLSQPVPRPSPENEASRTAAAGWNSLERDFLAVELHDDTPLQRFDAHGAVTSSGRIIDRLELRGRHRPCTWIRIDTWQEQFPRIGEEQK
jgi:hypothetical protein